MQSPSREGRFLHRLVGGLVLACGLVGLAIAAGPSPAEGSQSVSAFAGRSSSLSGIPLAQATADEACRLCHGDSTRSVTFPSGESLPVLLEMEVLAGSAHGDLADGGLACTDCHLATEYQFPHQPVAASDLRSYQLARSTLCERCHQQPHITSHLEPDGTPQATCTDCHGSHDVLTVDQWQAGEGTAACVDCHAEAGVARTDPLQLAQIIRDGLFADRVDSTYCLACHGQPGLALTFENGDVLPLTIDADRLQQSVHGANNPWQPLDCTDCHDRYVFPHQRPAVTSEREYNLQRYTFCAKCHEQNYEKALDSVHEVALEDGNLEAAVCTDCHGAHGTPPPDQPRERISLTCRQCHSTIFAEYSESVHGAALLADSNPDVPVCTNCHGVHNINDPTTALARIRSPQLCAGCHADVDLMNRYDISTEVFDTYVADFHGTTVTLFEHQDPDVETNKAVCYDCHGVHNIKSPDDPQAGIRASLLATCRQCHPDASVNFPDAWTSHFQPSLEHNPLVFLVDRFYAIVIPATIGFFGFLVATDVYRRVRMRILSR